MGEPDKKIKSNDKMNKEAVETAMQKNMPYVFISFIQQDDKSGIQVVSSCPKGFMQDAIDALQNSFDNICGHSKGSAIGWS